MRILSVSGNLGRGGTQRVVQNFSIGYKRLGHQVAVLAHQEGGVRQAKLEAAGISVFIGSDSTAMKAVDAFDPDVIHIHRPGMAEPRETKLMRELKSGSRAKRKIVETNVFGRVDYSAGNSLVDVHFHLTRWCFWKWRRCVGWGFGIGAKSAAVVVPNAVETRDFPETHPERIEFRRKFGLPEDAYVCGHVGQGISSNWNEATFRAFEHLAKISPQAHFLLRGLPDVFAPTIAAMPEDVRRRIHVTPMSDSDAELRALYGALDCYIHAATTGESFGMALTEAMLCGVPIVTTSRPAKGNSQIEVVRHGIDGLVAGSLQHVPEAVEKMWRDSDFRRKCQTNVRRSVIDRFDTDHVAQLAVRVMEIALASYTRRNLRERLRNEKSLITQVTDEEVQAMIDNTLGGPDVREVKKMWLLHTPLVQRAAQMYLELTFYRKLRRQAAPARS